MSTSTPMETYKQFLAAEQLSRALIMKYGGEVSGGTLVIYGDIQIEEAFAKVCAALGYEQPAKISSPIRPDEAA
jgi:hypothetical protein